MVQLEHCLECIGPETTNEEKILGMMGLCRFLDPSHPELLQKIFSAIDFNYLKKLLVSKAEDHLDYHSVAVNILGAFATSRDLAQSQRMKDMVHSILSLLEHHHATSLFQETIDLLERLSYYEETAEAILTCPLSTLLITTLVLLEEKEKEKGGASASPLARLLDSLLSHATPSMPCPKHFMDTLVSALSVPRPHLVACVATFLKNFAVWFPVQAVEPLVAWLRLKALPKDCVTELLVALSHCTAYPTSCVPTLLARASVELQMALERGDDVEPQIRELQESLQDPPLKENVEFAVACCCRLVETCVIVLLDNPDAAILNVRTPLLQIRNTVLAYLQTRNTVYENLQTPMVQAQVRLAALLVSEIDDKMALEAVVPLFKHLIERYPKTYAELLANCLFQWGYLEMRELQYWIERGQEDESSEFLD